MVENTFIPDRSIAVLPLVNLSPDPDNEYFSDGMTEEIINALNKVNGLKVTARTSSFSFKKKELDVRDIGKQLGVRTVLEGSVRKAGNQLRITVQLAEAVDGYQLWSESFDRQLEDVFALQDEISLLIADKIRENFGHLDVQEQLVPKATDDVEAYDLFLKGREQMLNWTAEGISSAVELFKQAVVKDPKFVRAYYELIWSCYILMAWKLHADETLYNLAEEYFQRAEKIDTQLPEYHFCLATKSFWLEWDFENAYKHIQNALSINPQYSVAIEGLVELLMATGNFKEAMTQIDRCLEVDPLSANHHYTKGEVFFYSGDTENALKFYQKSLEINSHFELAANKIAITHTLNNDPVGLHSISTHLTEPTAANHLFDLRNRTNTNFDEVLANKLLGTTGVTPWGLLLWANSGNSQKVADKLKEQLDHKLGQVINFRFDPMLQPLLNEEAIQPYLPIDFEPNFTVTQQTAVQKEVGEDDRILEQLMQEGEIFLDPELSLRSLAERMNITPNRLSWIINEVMGKNFNEYVNGYRLETFKQKALDPANKNFTLLGLAYESGFNSKSVFNQFFKKATGITPRAWVKARQLEK